MLRRYAGNPGERAGVVLRLAWLFLRIGAVAFGGLGATVALVEEELTRRRRLLSLEVIGEALTSAKVLPGSTVVQVVAFVTFRLGGWLCAAICTAAFLLPSALAMLILAYGYGQLAELPTLAPVRRGVLAAVVGLLLLTMYRLTRTSLPGAASALVAMVAFAVAAVGQLNAAWIVLAAGVLGVLSRR